MSYKQAQKKSGIQIRSTVLVWLRKHGRLYWKSKLRIKDKAPPKKQINNSEAKIKHLEQEKEILSQAIDTADDMLGTDIRKKPFTPVIRIFQAGGAQRITTRRIAESLGYSRQNYYKFQNEAAIGIEKHVQVKHLVDKERKLMPRLVNRKIYHRMIPQRGYLDLLKSVNSF